jgi:LacI family transcriptional regulator
MKIKREVTIYDIANKLKLSSATISRALQNNPAVNIETRKKIQAEAQKLGYRPNELASSLRKQKTNTLGVILHELNSNFITSVLSGIEQVARESGYDLIIVHSSESSEKEVANAMNLFNKRVDGLIVSLAFDTKNLNHFRVFEEKNIPVVFFDRVEEDSHYTKVIIDNYRAGYLATEHLIEQGCKRLALITSSQERNVYSQRHKGFRDALTAHKLNYKKENVIIENLSEQGAIEASKRVLAMKPLPDGVFITNDFSAAVCMHYFKEHGIKIPKDMAIVGFNNDAICKIVEPPLTTINYPGVTIGEIACRSLVEHLKGVRDLKSQNTFVVQSELVVRKSSVRKGLKVKDYMLFRETKIV